MYLRNVDIHLSHITRCHNAYTLIEWIHQIGYDIFVYPMEQAKPETDSRGEVYSVDTLVSLSH
jgi:collagenase-like PrtC family protease